MRAAERLVLALAVAGAVHAAGCECSTASHTLSDGGDGGMDAAVGPGRDGGGDAGEGGPDAASRDGSSPAMDATLIPLDGRERCGSTTEMVRDNCPADEPMCCDCHTGGDLESGGEFLCFPSTILDRSDCPGGRWCGTACWFITGCWESAPEGSEHPCGGDSDVPLGFWVDWRLCPADRPHCCLARGGFVCADHALYGRYCSSPPDP